VGRCKGLKSRYFTDLPQREVFLCKNMVTKIEIGQFVNTEKGVVPSKNREVIAELPDYDGRYETHVGEVGLSFSEHKKLGYKYVELEIGKTKELQTRCHRERRKINVSNEGKGQVQISRGRVLYVTTDAFR